MLLMAVHASLPGYMCVRVSYGRAKQLATSEGAWPALCMFQRVALHVSRSTVSQNPNHTLEGVCAKTHTQTHTETHTGTLAQGTLGMGIHVGWLRGPDVFMSTGVRLGFTLIPEVTEYTHTHRGVRAVTEETQAAHGTLVCCIKGSVARLCLLGLFSEVSCSTAARLRSSDISAPTCCYLLFLCTLAC